jgi:putative ABC transport system permease protein
MRRSEWLDTLGQDLAYGLRLMRGNPSLTAAIGLTIALGIGATTSIFSVVNAVLLRQLPYTDADRLVALRERMGEEHGSVAVGPFLEWSAKSSSFVATALAQGRTYNLGPRELIQSGFWRPVEA